MENFSNENNVLNDKDIGVAVSVVIPLYNSERFIQETLKSLLNETFKSYEVIVIDDASNDRSVEIVENMREQFDDKLRLITLSENSGGCPGIPRNVGLNMAKGKYICFLDSDDLLTPTALQELYSIAEEINADVLRADTRYRYRQGIEIDKLPISRSIYSVDKITFESDSILERMRRFTSGKFGGHPPWKHFIRRDFLIENKIEFPKLHILEDNFFAFYLFACAKVFAYVPNAVYVYRYRTDSISHKEHPIDEDLLAYITDISYAIQSVDEFMDRQKFFKQHPEWKINIFNYIFRRRRISFSKIHQLSVNDFSKRYNNVQEIFFNVFSSLQWKSLPKIAAYYFCIATGLQSEVTKLNGEMQRLRIFAQLNKLDPPEGALTSYFDTVVTISKDALKIIHSKDITNAVIMVQSKNKFAFYVPARKKFIASINDKGDVTLQNAKCFIGEVVSNSNQTLSLKIGNNFLSARKDGSCLLMKNNKAWEFFKTVGQTS